MGRVKSHYHYEIAMLQKPKTYTDEEIEKGMREALEEVGDEANNRWLQEDREGKSQELHRPPF